MQSASDLAVFADKKANAPVANYVTKPVSQSKLWDTVVGTFNLYDTTSTSGMMMYPIAIITILLASSFYPLAAVPFGVLAPGFAIVLFALGLTARDGVLVLAGFLLTGLADYLIWETWPF